ncbi:MAG: beta-ketoacyl-[acyl-carrier-protein] synthase family protein, partial [Bacteroidales bacterium]|nr:beta-ketoacyl-[acyl-carrier-protein] synthase family protein [Bacteroidales bacterium]
MPPRVVVTGIGIISSIGQNIPETLQSLKSSKSGIGPITNLNTIHKGTIPVAEIKLSDEELAELAGFTDKDYLTRTSLLGFIAAKEAFNSAGLEIESTYQGVKTGIVSATTVGGMDKTEKFYYDFISNNKYTQYVYSHDCCDSTEKIAELLGIKDYMTTISTACSSSANAIMFATRLIKNGIVDRVIAGGTDALSKFTLNGFNTLKILDSNPCQPFDNNRMGLNLGEGAGYLILESEEIARKNKSKILCEVSGYANTNDAYHQTASSPDGFGAYLAMKQAIEISGIPAEDIDYINAHGTGTNNNDLTEGIAIEKIFAPAVPKVSSTKPFTGHTLAAAGSIEAIFSVLAIANRMVFPNLNFKEKIGELSF